MDRRFLIVPFYPLINFCFLTIANGGFHISKTHRFLSYLLKFLLLEPFRLSEVLLFDCKIRKHELSSDPIFVLGHWRSGTSHLQNLLRQDPATTSISIYSSLFSDNYFVTSRFIKPLLQSIAKLFKIKYSIQRTALNLDYPGELDTALCSFSSVNSYTWGHLFSNRWESWLDTYIDIKETDKKNKFINDYDYLIKKVSYFSGGKRVIVKSPGDMARIHVLKERYPKAKFIYIHRDPIDVYHSNQFLWGVIRKGFTLQKTTDEQVHRYIIHTYKVLITNYIEQCTSLTDNDLIEVHFSDLQQAPRNTISRIYNQLELGHFDESIIESLVVSNKQYRPNKYVSTPELINLLKDEWKASFEKWQPQ